MFGEQIQLLLPKKNTSSSNIIISDSNNQPILQNTTAANFMNECFVNIGPNLNILPNSQWSYDGIYVDDTLPVFQIDEHEFCKLCNDININKSSAIDNISSKILKIAFLSLRKQMTYLFNLSFNTGKIPDKWKSATVTPLPKDGGLTQCTNYRPISQLPLPGKIMENLVHNRITNFFDTHNVFNPNQGGFRKK